MEASKRMFINTIVQYAKAIINTGLSLYTVRLILLALGKSDYGVYSLIAGVISLLGFIQNAMVITTQRYLSYYYGKNNIDYVRKIFSNSLILHLIIGVALSLFILFFKNYLCKDFLNIADNRREAALIVYIMAIGMMFVTFITAPFKALFIAKENIIFVSVIEIIDGFLKLILAIIVLRLEIDKLISYSIMMFGIVGFEFFIYVWFAIANFKECKISTIKEDLQFQILKNLAGFAGWTTYGMASVIIRTQGIAILLNKFFGTILNAAYGIAIQCYGAVSFIATSIINAMNPQIMKAEGANDRNKMMVLAAKESKFIVALMALLFIPLITEMNSILKVWLNSIPPYACFLTQCLLISFLIDQTTYGLHTANQAVGKIKVYTLIMYTPKILVLPACYIALHFNYGIESVMYIYLAVEFIVAMSRLPFMHYEINLDILKYIKEVTIKQIAIAIIISIVCVILNHTISTQNSFLMTIPLSIVLNIPTVWFIALDKNERIKMINFIKCKL